VLHIFSVLMILLLNDANFVCVCVYVQLEYSFAVPAYSIGHTENVIWNCQSWMALSPE